MVVKVERKNGSVIAMLNGEIDHHSAKALREAIDNELIKGDVRELVLDFAGVGFMDSSGLGVIFGRYNKLIAMKAKLKLINVPKRIERILRMAGVYTLIGRGAAENTKAACGGNNND